MFSPPGEARRSVGSVQERIRPGIPDETSSWRWGEPAPPPHLHFIFIFTFKTRREDPVFSKQAKWLIWGYNLVIMCHFWDCSVGNSHLKAFFTSSLDGTAGSSMVYADSRASAFCFFFFFCPSHRFKTTRVGEQRAQLQHSRSVPIFCTRSESMSYWYGSPRQKLPLFRSTVPFCARPLIPRDSQKNDFCGCLLRLSRDSSGFTLGSS